MVKLNQSALGKKATYNYGDLKFEVIIKDVKSAYGVERYLIVPVSGSGHTWVFSKSVKVLS